MGQIIKDPFRTFRGEGFALHLVLDIAYVFADPRRQEVVLAEIESVSKSLKSAVMHQNDAARIAEALHSGDHIDGEGAR